MKTRSIVYVDGFNFYYGALRGTPNRWLNLERCFRLLRQSDQLERIYYFTALVDGDAGFRQASYLSALATLPLVTTILGKFKTKTVKCRAKGCHFAGPREFDAPEEKRTDVNIAVRLLDDALHDRADCLVLVSGDSDLVPAVDIVKERRPEMRIIAYIPSRNAVRGAAVELRAAADKHRTFPQALLRVSQFPSTVHDGRGGVIAKPPSW